MTCLFGKSRANRGASILMALAVVLVCTTVAAIVLIAAAANVGKGSAPQQRNAAYYAVASATQLLADDMERENPSASVSTAVSTYACQQAHPTYVHADAGVEQTGELVFASANGASTPFVQLVETAFRAIDPADEGSTYTSTFFIDAPDLARVQARFTMDYAYNITVELDTAEGDYHYAQTLQIPAVAGAPVETTEVKAEDAHMDGWEYNEESASVPWKETTTLNPTTGAYEPASNEYGHSVEQLYDITTTTTTSSVTWGSPVVSKGAM